MARFFKITELEARKRALVAESEVYRETLKLEVQNLRLYHAAVRHRLALLRSLRPVLLFALPLLGSLWRRKPRSERPRSGWLRYGLLGWRLYRQFGPLLRELGFGRLFGGRGTAGPEA